MATIDVLFEGYTAGGADGDRVASTVSLVRDADAVIVVDPGLVPGPEAILGPLAALGVGAAAVTDVVFSHHHPDHTLNAALFPEARFHDHWAIYRGDEWISRDAEGFELSPDVSLIETPGHTPQDITTLVRTGDGIVALTHLWWSDDTPVEDPYATDPAALHAGRARVLEVASLIVPGHGARFVPGRDTPR
jgi:glyoxylase-like metal-dependent hydrolase (beta-lactamase superfamily II)